MPNIILNNYCNLNCPYCFAGIIKQENPNDITQEQLQNILNWLELDTFNYTLGIIGGEPTLHYNFLNIMKQIYSFCKKNKINYNIFTNGIELYKFIRYLPDETYYTLNYNSPEILTSSQKINLDKTLQILNLNPNKKSHLALGCNICNEINDYSFFWDAIKNYNLNPLIRVSVAAPIYNKDKINKEIYYKNLKQKFITFLQNANKINANIIFDCNQIPLCYFTQDEIKKYNLQTNLCKNPAIDITPDFQFISCFGTSIKLNKENFNNLTELQNYIKNNIYPELQQNNNSGKCENCIKLKNQECQGGCLAFSKKLLGQEKLN